MNQLSSRDQIVEYIKNEIRTGGLRSGDPMPAERKMAERFQVARDTVRRAYQELARQGCILAHGRSRRTVAALQPAPHSLLQNTFAVLGTKIFDPEWFERVDAEDHYVLANAARHIQKAGFHVIFVNPHTLLEHGVESITAARPRGVLLATTLLRMKEIEHLVQTLRDTDAGVLIYGDEDINVSADRLYSDHVDGAEQLTDWLVARGRKRILMTVTAPELPGFMVRRYEGLTRGLSKIGEPVLDPLTIPLLNHQLREQLSFEDQVRIVTGYLAPHLTGGDPVEALMAINDPDAYLLSAACRALGLKPNKDVLIVGYDNSGIRATEREWESVGPIATVDKCNGFLAEKVAELAIARVRRQLPEEAQEVILHPKLLEL